MSIPTFSAFQYSSFLTNCNPSLTVYEDKTNGPFETAVSGSFAHAPSPTLSAPTGTGKK